MNRTSVPVTIKPLAYSVGELPALIGLGRSTIQKILNSGTLPARKVGNRTLVLREDVERYLRTLPAKAVP